MTSFPAHLFSEPVGRFQPSGIEEMVAYLKEPGMISFSGGMPAPDTFPVESFAECAAIIRTEGTTVLQYDNPQGYAPLREFLASWTSPRMGRKISPEEILVTAGSMQGAHLFALALLNPGEYALIEEPTFMGVTGSMSNHGVRFIGIPCDHLGIRVDLLEETVRRGREEGKVIKCLYTIPNFQNPSGRVTSSQRRLDILELAKKYDFLILEDDPYRHLYYDAPPPGTYLAMQENDGRVIYLGSFSKLIAPGIRCGWMIAPPELYKKFHQIRVTNDLNLPTILHEGIFRFLSDYDFQDHLKTLRKTYGEKRDGMVEALKRHLAPEDFLYELPRGGFFLWGRAPWLHNSMEFATFAVTEEKIGLIPGEIFFTSPENYRDTLRLSFAKVSPAAAEEGCARLARAMERYRRRG